MYLQVGYLSRIFPRNIGTPSCSSRRFLNYIQGQEPEPRIREYFYYIDHQGMEKKFLDFFFKRIRINKTGRYEDEFPYVSLCGRERNYIRCDDVPVVFTHIIQKTNMDKDYLSYGHAGEMLTLEFLPNKIYMLPQTGRVYHPADDKYGGIGLIRSKLAIELSKNFQFQDGESQPTHFRWKNTIHEIDRFWFDEKLKQHNVKIKTELE